MNDNLLKPIWTNVASIKPNRSTSESRGEFKLTKMLSFGCWNEWRRLMRGAAFKLAEVFSSHRADFKKVAFTLAEVLVTLGIIGVVTAITIPTLVNNIQDRHFKALWKKTFATVSLAFNQGINDNDLIIPTTENFDSFSNNAKLSAEIYYRTFVKLNASKFCVTGVNNENCFVFFRSQVAYELSRRSGLNCHSLNGDKDDVMFTTCAYNLEGGWAVLPNGVLLTAHSYLWSSPNIMVDVNGDKKPNVVGRDIFIILIRNNKVIAGGAPSYELKGCDKAINSSSGFVDAESFSGSGCGYKYLYEK